MALGSACRAPELNDEQRSNRFGHIFNLPSFAEPSAAVKEALLDLGRRGGLMDARDDLSAGPVALLTNPALSANNPDNPTHTAGATYFAEFLDHELTRDGRVPAFDLDTVYGGGPLVARRLYKARDTAKLRVGNGGMFEDLPRAADNTAIVAEPRTDENLIVGGLHTAFLRAHNRLVDRVRAQRGRHDDYDFEDAQRLLRWHYQWLIVHEFLPLFVGQSVVDNILKRGRRFFTPERAFVPVDFQGAAFRFRHSMARPSYRANLGGDNGRPFIGFIFDPARRGGPDPSDLAGGARAARRFIGWQSFFDFGDGQVQHNKRIGPRISTPLFHLPSALPQRTLLKHLSWSLPSGQAIARAMYFPLLAPRDLDELAEYELRLERHTPLFYYVLKEAQLVEDGLHLGPIGGRIVGEVILGLLQLDPASYLAAQPDWRPILPSRAGRGEFRMTDLLTFAGVDPVSRGQ